MDFPNTAMLTVANHLQITAPPTNEKLPLGASCTFMVAATGGFAPLTYTWRHYGRIVGSDPTLTIDPIGEADFGSYTVEIVDSMNDAIQAGPVELMENVPLPGMVIIRLTRVDSAGAP